MSTWNRSDAMEFATVMVDQIVPHYRLLIESFEKAQNVQRDGRETKLDLLDAGKGRGEGQGAKRGMQPVGAAAGSAACESTTFEGPNVGTRRGPPFRERANVMV